MLPNVPIENGSGDLSSESNACGSTKTVMQRQIKGQKRRKRQSSSPPLYFAKWHVELGNLRSRVCHFQFSVSSIILSSFWLWISLEKVAVPNSKNLWKFSRNEMFFRAKTYSKSNFPSPLLLSSTSCQIWDWKSLEEESVFQFSFFELSKLRFGMDNFSFLAPLITFPSVCHYIFEGYVI